MKMELDLAQGHWQFTDDHGTVWRLVPTGHPTMPLTITPLSRPPRDATDDVGIDQEGRPFMLGDEARRENERIVDHPDAVPVLVIARLDDDAGVRVFGPPSQETADLLDQVAHQYRTVVAAALRKTPH